MQRYDIYCDQDMIPHQEESEVGDWVWHEEAQDALAAARAEIERLTKAHDTVCGALAEAIKRAEKAETALEAYGREKVREGMQRAADIARGFGGEPAPMGDGCGTIILRNLNGHDVAEALLAAMEKEGGE